MNTQGSGTEVLRFEILVNGEAYRSLVVGLRGGREALQPPRAQLAGVRAQIDLDLSSRSYSVTTLGRHRLPSALFIKPGTRTHNSLTRLIARSIRQEQHREVASLIHDIIEATPHIPRDTLDIRKQDIEDPPAAPLSPPPSAPYAQSIGARGLIESVDENVRIAPAVAGLISAVRVKVGDEVQAGQVLIEQDARDPFKARV